MTMRKTLIVLISIAFTGALLVYTAQANLDLLTKIYVNPEYVGFGLLALEGGVLYWTGYYLLHWNGTHKGIAVFMVVLDFLLSMIGFFMDTNLHTGDSIKTALPPVQIVMWADVAVNVGMGIIVHFLSHGSEPQQQQSPAPRPKHVQDTGETDRPLEQMSFAQTGQIPFWSRMKVATEAFKGASKYRWTPTDIKSQLSQPAQQEAVQETQSQPISPADLERMAQLKHSDMFHLENLLGKENYQALLRQLVQGQGEKQTSPLAQPVSLSQEAMTEKPEQNGKHPAK